MNEHLKLINNLEYEIDVKRTTLAGDSGWFMMTLKENGQVIDVEQPVRTDFMKIDDVKHAISSGIVKAESHLMYKLDSLAMRAVAHSIAHQRVELVCVKPYIDKYLSNQFVSRDFTRELEKHGYSLDKYENDLFKEIHPEKPKVNKPKM